MIGISTTYLVDTNTLTQLKKQRRASKFFKQNARIPADVLVEAEQFPDIASLRELEYEITPGVLRELITVMASVDSHDTKLVDLYANRGGADPVVIASALNAIAQESQYLNPQEWVVVTGDNAVRSKATALDLLVISNKDFAALIDKEEDCND